jgi:purine-binding chemotaxis protein CheW
MLTSNPATPSPNQPIDWSEIHNRLEATRQALLYGTALTVEEKHTILKGRARLLAQVPQQVAAAQEFLEIVEFRLAAETYGLESAFIREVYPLKDFTPLPGVPSFVLGIVNVHGQILSIIDLKKFFDLSEKGIGQLNKLIILENGQMSFGILVDEILGAHRIALDTIQAVPPTLSGTGAEYLRGVTIERIIVLDAEKILNDEKIIVHQEAE